MQPCHVRYEVAKDPRLGGRLVLLDAHSIAPIGMSARGQARFFEIFLTRP
jgi:hypothetical protein